MRVNLRLLSHSGDGVWIVTMPELTLRADDSAEMHKPFKAETL
nr:MAG TPA: hypothetical protein [Caudoviricetes sp.]